jgi:hypothetical protein
MRPLLLGALIVATQPVLAEDVYHAQNGRWQVNGYVEGNDRSCVFSYRGKDGTAVNLNIFPTPENSLAQTSITLANPDLVSAAFGDAVWKISAMFTSTKYGERERRHWLR